MTRAALVAVVGAALAACGPPPRPVFPPPLVEVGPASAATAVAPARAAALREAAQSYEQATGDFSAAVSVSLRDLSRGQSFSGTGGLALRRAERAMRLQVTGVGGVTALDMLAREGVCHARVAGRAWERAPLDAVSATGGGAGGAGLPACAVAAAMLGVDWSRAEVLRDGAIAVARVPVAGTPAVVAFDARDGAVREVRWFDARGAEHARVRFEQFTREANGARFPRVALFWRASPPVNSTVTVENRTLAPTLPPATFAPP